MSRQNQKMSKEKMAELRESIQVILIEVLILAGILSVVTFILYFRFPEFTEHFKSVAAFQSFMHAHQKDSYLFYIGLQIIQIVVSVIPGQIVQIAGGYLYGFWLSALLSVIGVGLGSVAAFYIARILGQGPVQILIGQKSLDQCSQILDSRTSYRIFFFLYLIPGFPKDILAYAAGLSRMKLRSFLPLATIVRFPAMAASMYIGSLLGASYYKTAAAVILLCAVLFGICVFFRKPMIEWIDRYFEKTSGDTIAVKTDEPDTDTEEKQQAADGSDHTDKEEPPGPESSSVKSG